MIFRLKEFAVHVGLSACVLALARGLPTDQPDTLFMIGYDRPVLAVFDRASLRIVALIRAN